MRTFPAALAAHLAGEATTLAHAWILRRTDGAVLGFTDHDRTLTVAGVPCEPAAGFDRSAATAHAGFAVGDEEVSGALTSDRITDRDLAAGLYDGARVEVHLLDWRNPATAVLVRAGTIGDVVRADGAFRAEVRGPAHALEQPSGRLFGRTCDAELGDARCGVALGPWRSAAVVAEADGPGRIRVSGVDGLPAGRFGGGSVRVTAGPLAGWRTTVAAHDAGDAGVWLALWPALPAVPAAGTALELTAGCDKHFSTCRDRFGNGANFRGFPHMPGNDFALGPARPDGDNDGQAVVR
ncbi:DUF2163 domain-containing protein [Chthonobacter rhizosphaerae]|uniref:DUF2163 domain-containing protein n=1 Tax=Chthonobacter rhizosphaerae TaxID=2735553 RepID=UPI0015EE6160|nr:DUF2163 domain-containing protein [Chthonobacter rhizosphaerae]